MGSNFYFSRKILGGLLLTAVFIFPESIFADAENKSAGLGVNFSAGKNSDVTSTPNVWFYVPVGKSATPFLPAEPFKAVWNGFVAVDLRGDYSFQAELNGSLKLEINGKPVLETTTNGWSELSPSIRLGKGATNILTATFSSPAQGDAYIRLSWKPKDSFVQPIPVTSLSHAASAEEKQFAQIRLGRELFLEYRCAKCHAAKNESATLELSMDAPSFDEIGARRNYEWMARWILDPKALRSTAHMPTVFRGEKAKENAEAAAAFLASLKPADWKLPQPELNKDAAEAGKKLFNTLYCVACHNAPDVNEEDQQKVSLKQVVAKFIPGTLTEFLKHPDAHYAWIRMPRFSLNDEQRKDLATFILLAAVPAKEVSAPAQKEVLELGKKLVQTSGCLNCHSAKMENASSTKSLAEISDWKKGCLAETPNDKAPDFHFSQEQREAIQAFAATDRSALAREVPSDFAERYSRTLNCRNCHGQFEGFPNFEILGEKLKAEWMTKFIRGEVSYKPRPWLEAQMPAFGKFSEMLAQGLAMQHGFAPQSVAEPTIDQGLATIGQRLVSAPPNGFACISCHSIGSVGATQVFEAPGINLIHTGERLQPSYFRRWVRNPPLVDPQTKMPAYFDDEGKSPIADVLDGDAFKQIDALWKYIRLGERMPSPQTQ